MSDDTEVLKAVCRDLRDSANGYREASELLAGKALGALFAERHASREQMIAMLEVRLQAALPFSADSVEGETEGSLRGELHQQFMHVKALFESDEEAAISTIQAIEQHLGDQLRQALHASLTLETYAIITDLVTLIDNAQASLAAVSATA